MKTYLTTSIFLTLLFIIFFCIYLFFRVSKNKTLRVYFLFLLDLALLITTHLVIINIQPSPFAFFVIKVSTVFISTIGPLLLHFVYEFFGKKKDIPYWLFLFISASSFFIYNFTPWAIVYKEGLQWAVSSSFSTPFYYFARPHGLLVLKTLFFLSVVLPILYGGYLLCINSKKFKDNVKKHTFIMGIIFIITGSSLFCAEFWFFDPHANPLLYYLVEIFLVILSLGASWFMIEKYGFLSLSLESFAEDMFKHAEIGIIIVNGEDKIENINKKAIEYLGIPNSEEVKGESIFKYLPDYNEKELKMNLNNDERYFSITKIPISRGEYIVGNMIMLTDVTTEKQLEKELARLNAELQEKVIERTVMLQKTVENLEEEMDARLAAERELRETMNLYKTLFESGGDAIFFHDAKGYIINVNKKGCQILKKTKDEIIGANFFDIVEFIEKEKDFILEKAKGNEDFLIEGKIKREDGKEIDIEANIKKVNISQMDYYLVFVRDVTARKDEERRLLELSKLESVSLLAGGIAHDFNNMLTAIFGNLSILKLKLKEREDLYERIEKIESVLENARSLTTQLLSLSKGGEPVKEITTIKNTIIDTVEFTLRGSPVRLKLDVPDELPPLDVDKAQISRVIQNIITNALEAMSDEGTLFIKVEEVDIPPEKKREINGDRALKITIQDTGSGIPKEFLPRIFDPFFSTKPNGSGLGLAVVYNIIKKHGGCIDVSSVEGEGTTFHIWLPISYSPVEKTVESLDKKENISLESAKILVMDDEEMIRDFLKDILTMHGFKVEVVEDGKEAIEKYKKAMEKGEPFDLVIMDLTIPGGMGGKEAIKILKDIDLNISVIVSSGYTDTDVLIRYEEYGFSGYLHKPYKLSELFSVISKVLQKK